MRWLSGDGQWLCLYQCVQPWAYRLFANRVDADVAAKQRCGDSCEGPNRHKTWRVIPTEELDARQALRAKVQENEAKLAADSQAEFWEARLGVDGL